MGFTLYTVDVEYCEYLKKSDPRVQISDKGGKRRPSVGIVFTLHGCSYCAPLVPPNEKHNKMKEQIDFLKISDGKYGVINLGGMIPVPIQCLKKFDLKVEAADTPGDVKYKELLMKQLSWCDLNRNFILESAGKLHDVVSKKSTSALAKRCCNFVSDEQQCIIYCWTKFQQTQN